MGMICLLQCNDTLFKIMPLHCYGLGNVLWRTCWEMGRWILSVGKGHPLRALEGGTVCVCHLLVGKSSENTCLWSIWWAPCVPAICTFKFCCSEVSIWFQPSILDMLFSWNFWRPFMSVLFLNLITLFKSQQILVGESCHALFSSKKLLFAHKMFEAYTFPTTQIEFC